jgi:replicative DNA helicase
MDSVTEIKARLSLEDIVGETVTLKLAGKNRLLGLCPFHAEKSPSFYVYVEKNRYHCFGCERDGDLFDFVKEAQGVDFPTALKQLAARAGVELPERNSQSTARARPTTATQAPPPKSPPTERAPTGQPERGDPGGEPSQPSWITDFVAQAHAALVAQASDEAKAALAYFTARGLGGLIDELHLGVVDATVRDPNARRFRGRAVVPTLEDGRGVWFKARDLRSAEELKANDVAKYLAPSGTTSAPYNPVALQHAVDANFLVLTEGEVDCASVLAANDLEYPAVGLPGGNVPQGWLEKIANVKVPTYLLMDPGDAGARHAERLQTNLGDLGVRTYAVQRDGDSDLNDLLIELGPEGMQTHLNALIEDAAREATSDILYIRETWLAELDARAARPPSTYTTGLEPLDRLLGGGYSEGLHLLGGITGGGKTSLALHVAVHNAEAGRPVVYASYEQSRLELWARIASGVTGVAYAAIKKGVFDDLGQKVLVSSQLKAAPGWGRLETISRNLKIVEGGDALSRQPSAYTVEVLGQTAQEIKAQYGAPPLVVIDYLQRAPAPQELRNKDIRERVGAVAGLLQVGLAREIGCPVLALSSIGRAAYDLQSGGLEKRLGAFKEAGEIEYTAYTALLLYGLSEELQTRLSLVPGLMSSFKPMTLDLVKNREGSVGQLGCQWYPARGTWSGAVKIDEKKLARA